MDIQSLIKYENSLILESIKKKFRNEISDQFNFDESKLNIIISPELSGNNCLVDGVHESLIKQLIYLYIESRGINASLLDNFNLLEPCGTLEECFRGQNSDLIPMLCDLIHIEFMNSKFSYKKGEIVRHKSKSKLVDKGAFYTNSDISYRIVKNTINNYSQNSNVNECCILDFACGSGRFYESIIKILSCDFDVSKEKAILDMVYAIDIDPIAVDITRLKAISFLPKVTVNRIIKITEHIICRNGLIRSDLFDEDNGLLKNTDLKGMINSGFDIIVSNPPYLALKINKENELLAQKIKNEVNYFRTSGYYKYSIDGVLNYYKLSIESMLGMLRPFGELGIICPSSLFADMSAKQLRKYILMDNQLREINYFSEKAQLFDNVNQATNIFYVRKNGVTDNIRISIESSIFDVKFDSIKFLFAKHMEVPFITKIEWGILEKLVAFVKLSEIESVRNRRGELDLTFYKDYITREKTKYRMIRGNMISIGCICNGSNEYVIESFLHKKDRDYINFDFNRKRLICQQISNMTMKRRLKFALCEESDILSNSCNYLSSDEDTLKKLLLILNSSLLNWRFKITSTNNHVNNYELGELPIPNLDLIDLNKKFENQQELDLYICNIYGLSSEEITFILSL